MADVCKEFHQVMNFNHWCDFLVLFSVAVSHCFKKVVRVDLKGKEGAQTNQPILGFHVMSSKLKTKELLILLRL